jgi:hypothetical protein
VLVGLCWPVHEALCKAICSKVFKKPNYVELLKGWLLTEDT